MSYSSEVLADSPLLYYRLGDSSGTSMVDASGNSRTGTYVNSPTLAATGIPGGAGDTAVTFDGTNDYATVPNVGLDTGQSFTGEAWVKGSLGTGSRVVMARWAASPGSSQRWTLGVDDASNGFPVIFLNSGGFPNATASINVLDGSWHHLVFTVDVSTLRLYVDGSAVSAVGRGGTSQVGDILTIGAKNDPTSYFAGTIDEVAVYGATLSAGRIAAHFAAGGPGDATVAAPAATASALAPVPVVSASSSVSPPVATATASAPVPTVNTGTNATVTPPAATATASAPVPTITQVIPAGTDTTNFLNGRNRRARASVTVIRPVGTPPSNLAPRHDKAVPLPPPTLVDGRVT